MIISADEMRNLHDYIRPAFSGEREMSISQEEKAEILAVYEKTEKEMASKASIEQRMNSTAASIALLYKDEKELIEARVLKDGGNCVREHLICEYHTVMATQFDIPEEHVIAMLMILRGAIAFANIVAMQDDIGELLGAPAK